MGNLCCCIKSENKDLEDHLLRYIFCDRCQDYFISNYEYNKHIYKCNQRYKSF
jgi:hypothetical protein